MAQYRLEVQAIKRADGRSAVAAAAYRSGERLLDERLMMTFDFAAKGGIEASGILAPESAPASFSDRATLWNTAEAADVRSDSRVAREILISLPHELDAAQRLALVQAFASESLVARGMIADFAIHRPDAHGDQRNFHAHVMVTTRTVGPDGFGHKARAWDNPEAVRAMRLEWEDIQNRHLRLALGEGAPQVSAKSLADQGLDQEATVHLGPASSGMERRGERSDRGGINRSVAQRNRERRDHPIEVREIEDRLAGDRARQTYPIGAVVREFEAIHQSMLRERAGWTRERAALRAPAIPSARSIHEAITGEAAKDRGRARAHALAMQSRVLGLRAKRNSLVRWIRNPGRMIWAKHAELNALARARANLAQAERGLAVRRRWLRSSEGQAYVAAQQHPFRLQAEIVRRMDRTLERKIRRADRRIEAVEGTRTKLLVAEALGETRVTAPADLSLGVVQAVREVDRTVVGALKAYQPGQVRQALAKVAALALGRGLPDLDL
jgi:hypothetical protein